MRSCFAALPLLSLAACGGSSGAESAGSVAPPVAPGTGNTPAHSFVAPTETKTYRSHGSVQAYSYDYVERVGYNKVQATDSSGNLQFDDRGNPVYAVDRNSRQLLDTAQLQQLYTADAATVRDPGITVTYDPRNAQFTLEIAQNGITENITFQDPAHRTNFSGAARPQDGVPNLENGGGIARGVQYLQVASGNNSDGAYDISTFFYEKPGTTTKHVTYAGFVRNRYDAPEEEVVGDQPRTQIADITRRTALERAAFVFGELSAESAIPRTGSATFTGNMIASMVNTPQLDSDPGQPTHFQWLNGTAQVMVDFGASSVKTMLSGTTMAPFTDPSPITSPTNTAGYTPPQPAIPAGAAFTASGSGKIDFAAFGGFSGIFDSASFTAGGQTQNVTIAGSAMEGAFYGAQAEELGANFRIVGGVPDQRVDIIGAFTAKK